VIARRPGLILLNLEPQGWQLCAYAYDLDTISVYKPLGRAYITQAEARAALVKTIAADEHEL